jgi:hypothetical protein
MNAAPTESEIGRRIAYLRQEIRAAEEKIPRTVAAIKSRKATLTRLEARLVLGGTSRAALHDNE